MSHVPESVREYLSRIGTIGGSASSDAKAKAAKLNAKKPRPNKRKPVTHSKQA